jgi:hypothetical protein
MIDLRSYSSLESAIFLKWEVPNFSTAYLSDYNTPLSFGGNTYLNIGTLLNVSSVSSELKPTKGEITIGLSGVPVGSISTILNQQIKGSTISIYRSYFNAVTHQPLDLGGGNTQLHFKGIVTNYSISDDIDLGAGIATSTITLTCNSSVEILSSKVSGRRTNQTDFPNVQDMSRVQALANSNFNFGAP